MISATTNYSYSDLLDRLTLVTLPGGGSKSFSYDDTLRQVTATTAQNSCVATSLMNREIYDTVGRSIRSETDSGTATIDIVQRAYDSQGRLRQVSNPYRSGDPIEWTTYSYDGINRPLEVVHPDTSVDRTEYSNNVTTIRDARQNRRDFTTDGLGRITTVIEYGPLPYDTTYAYDVLNNLTGVTQGSQTRAFSYDSLGRLKNVTNPESQPIGYTYDDNGNPLTKSQNGVVVQWSNYDGLNRPGSKTYNDGTPAVSYVYDTCQNGFGRTCSVTAANGTIRTYSYDVASRVVASRQTTGGVPYDFTYTYNDASGLETMTYPSGREVSYCYDRAGRPSQVLKGDLSSSDRYVQQASYAPHGGIASLTLGTNVMTEAWQYNNRLQPRETKVNRTRLEADLLKLEYYYCANQGSTCSTNNGNMLSQRIGHGAVDSESSWSRLQEFTYDTLNRLTGFNESGAVSETSSYDRWGNRWATPQISNETPAAENWYLSAKNHVNGWGYDGAGNITVIGGMYRAFDYDAENRQISATINEQLTTYEYDGEGNRVRKVTGANTWTYVYDAFGQLAAEYTNVASPDSGTQYLTTDHLGSTRLRMSATGTVVKRHDI